MDLVKNLLSIPSEQELQKQSQRIAKLKLLSSSSDLCFQYNHFNPSKYKFNKKYTESWNKHINNLLKDENVVKSLQSLFDFDVSEGFLKAYLFRLISQLNAETMPQLIVEKFQQLASTYEKDDKVELLIGLSVLELCLIIAIKHHSEIYDRDPFNFEIICARFVKFAKISSTMQGIERAVALKAFEHLRNLEIIMPLSGSNSSGKVQKEFEMHKLALTYSQIDQAVQKYQALPTEVAQWAQSSIL